MEDKRSIIALEEKGGQKMAEFPCSRCSCIKNIGFGNYKDKDVLRGVVFCECGEQTIFEMERNFLSFLPGKMASISHNPNIPEDARQKFTEARLCFFAPAPRAAAIMLRASLESALTERGITARTLELQIDKSLENDVIGKREYTLAHGTRLVGKEAVHKSTETKPAEVLGIFGAVIQILDKVYP